MDPYNDADRDDYIYIKFEDDCPDDDNRADSEYAPEVPDPQAQGQENRHTS